MSVVSNLIADTLNVIEDYRVDFRPSLISSLMHLLTRQEGSKRISIRVFTAVNGTV
jgi:hypothetical protein